MKRGLGRINLGWRYKSNVVHTPNVSQNSIRQSFLVNWQLDAKLSAHIWKVI
jgi:hypothetical protein